MPVLTGRPAQSPVHSAPLVSHPWRLSTIQPLGRLPTAFTIADAPALRQRIGHFLHRDVAERAIADSGAAQDQLPIADAVSNDATAADLRARLDRLLKDGDGRSSFVFVRFRRRPVVPPPPPPSPPAPREPWAETDSTDIRSTVRDLTSEHEPGAPLAQDQRATFEPLIGTALKDVRIHTGPIATATARALGAEAFTIGHDVFFRQGRFEPSTRRGEALLAHELMHVGQQTTRADRAVADHGRPDVAEAEAEAIERTVLARDRGGGGGLSVGKYVRNYAGSDGQPISRTERERLDAVSLRALEVCERVLASSVIGAVNLEVARLQVDVQLDLDRLTDEQAAEIWGHALAAAIRRKVGAPAGR